MKCYYALYRGNIITYFGMSMYAIGPVVFEIERYQINLRNVFIIRQNFDSSKIMVTIDMLVKVMPMSLITDYILENVKHGN